MEGGATLRQHLKVGERNSRRQVEQLHKTCPPGTLHIWEWFLALGRGRQRSEGKPCPISYTEIVSWASLTNTRPTPSEVEVLKWLDAVYLTVAMENNSG